MRTLVCPLLVVALALSIAVPSKAWGAGEPAGMKVEERRPVIIVGRPNESLKALEPLCRAFRDRGMNPDRDLFVYIPEEVREDVPLLAGDISSFALQCRAKSGAQRVDVIGIGLSGFACRYAIETGRLPGEAVANLVMIASPNRGSFAAEVMRSVYEVARQEAMLEEETRWNRFSPIGGVVEAFSHEHEYVGTDSALPPQWESEAGWIATRSRNLYEPLYERYVRERFFRIPYVPAQSPNLTFAGWISATRPDLWRSLMERLSPPVKGKSTGNPWCDLPKEGEDFSTAYYEILSMMVARDRYVMRMASKNDLIQRLMKDAYIPSDPNVAIAYYGGKVVSYYAEKLFITWKAKAQEKATAVVSDLLGLGDNPGAPVMRRLMKESVLVNLGLSASQRFFRVPANVHLADANLASSVSSHRRPTRYVNIAVEGKNPWQMIFPGIGPNAYGCEVDSAVAPLGPTDLVRVFKMGLGKDALEDRVLIEYTVSVTNLEDEKVSFPLYSLERLDNGKLTVSSWRPVYVTPHIYESSQEGGAHPVPQVRLDLPSPPVGWSYLVWRASGANLTPVSNSLETLRGGGSIGVIVGEKEAVGIRLIMEGPVNPVFGGEVGSAFSEETLVKIGCWSHLPMGQGTGDALPDESGNNGAEDAEIHDGGSAAPYSGDTGDTGSDWVSGNTDESERPAEGSPENDIPTVRVVYRSKHTTLKKPEETSHARWLVDFGDGQTQEIEGRASLELVHTYALAGSYRAKLTSIDASGGVILEKECDVICAGGSCQVRLTASSLQAPSVDLQIAGPPKWVTGKAAVYETKFSCDLPPQASLESVVFDPGEVFRVLWERSGEFIVSAAVTLRIRYRVEGREFVVKNTYVQSVPVEVFTLGVTK